MGIQQEGQRMGHVNRAMGSHQRGWQVHIMRTWGTMEGIWSLFLMWKETSGSFKHSSPLSMMGSCWAECPSFCGLLPGVASLTGALGRMRIMHLQVYFPLTNPQLFNNKLLCSNGCEWTTLAWLTCLPGLRISDWTSGLLHMSSLWSQLYGSFPGYALLPVGHSTRGWAHQVSPVALKPRSHLIC